MSRRARVLVPVLVSIAALAILFVGIFPTRAFLSQRAAIAAAEEQLHDIESTNAALEERVRALRTPEEIERIAREQYSLVYPGERAFALLPAPQPRLPVPNAWPFRSLHAALSEN